MPRQFDVVIERNWDGCYVASVPQLAGYHTQARSFDKVTERIREAIELCPEAEGTPELPESASNRAWSHRALRVKGSHHFLRHGDGRSTVLPVHAGEMIGLRSGPQDPP